MSEELKPCPFCGGPAELVTAYKGSTAARCTDFNCAGYVSDTALRDEYDGYRNTGAAVDAWNRRTAPDAPAMQAEPVAFEWPQLDAPAKVGGVIFGSGVSTESVIKAAKRHAAERPRTFEEKQEAERARRELWDKLNGSPYDTPPNGDAE